VTEDRVFAGIKTSPLRCDDVLAAIDARVADRQTMTVTFLNPDYARRALQSEPLRRDINAFDLVLVDGNGVRLLTPLFGFTVPERVDTDSLAGALFRRLAERRGSVFLLGCAPGVAQRAADKLVRVLPDLTVAGVEHGYHDVERGHPGRFADEDSDRIVADINASGADVVLVSLPTPLQQRWVAQHAGAIKAPVVMTAGSYLDHLAEWDGQASSWYPRWADALRLNWFYRLIREPRRLWRRYTLEIVGFVALTVRARLSARRR
jgi:N-acetylglucosaminyldiphosphoundecaprenol N-acetyl-beta-D-mannosaminyltransferase